MSVQVPPCDPCAKSVDAALVSSGFRQGLFGQDHHHTSRWHHAFEIAREIMCAYNVTHASIGTLNCVMTRGCRNSLWAACLLYFSIAPQHAPSIVCPRLTAHAINAALENRSLAAAHHIFDFFLTQRRRIGVVESNGCLGTDLVQARMKTLAKTHKWKMALDVLRLNPESINSISLGYAVEACGRSRVFADAFRVVREHHNLVDHRVVDSILVYITSSRWEHNLRTVALTRAQGVLADREGVMPASFVIASARTIGSSGSTTGWVQALHCFLRLSKDDRCVAASSLLRVLDRLDDFSRARREVDLLSISLDLRQSLMLPNYSTLLLHREIDKLIMERHDSRTVTIVVIDTNVLLSAIMVPSFRATLEQRTREAQAVLVPLPVIREVSRHIRVGRSSVVARYRRRVLGVSNTVVTSRKQLWGTLTSILTEGKRWRIASPLQHYRAIENIRVRHGDATNVKASDQMDMQILRYTIAVQRELAAAMARGGKEGHSRVELATRDEAFKGLIARDAKYIHLTVL